MKNECLDAATAVLDEAGVSYSVGKGGKHFRIDFEINGRRCRGTAPVSPSDYRSPLNAAAQMRRILRDAQGNHSDSVRHDGVPESAPSSVALLFESSTVRIVEHEGAHWFVAADVCGALGLSNPSMSIKPLDADERSKKNLGRQGEATIISEAGLYVLALRCREALEPGSLPYRFRKWVTGTVLPTIRKHGAYAADPALMREIERLSAKLANVEAAADLALEAASRIESGKIAPTIDLASTITSDDLISTAGIKPGQRVRGTSAMVTGRMLTFTAGHGCFKTPAHLNPSMPWRFPREKGHEWLFGAQLGAEQIRSQIERQRRKKAQRARPSQQGHLTLVGAP